MRSGDGRQTSPSSLWVPTFDLAYFIFHGMFTSCTEIDGFYLGCSFIHGKNLELSQNQLTICLTNTALKTKSPTPLEVFSPILIIAAVLALETSSECHIEKGKSIKMKLSKALV